MTAARGWPWRRVALFAGPPTAWMAHLLVSYLLVPPACDTSTVPLHATTAVCIVAALASVALGIRSVDARRGRSTAALALGALFVLAIVLQGTANAMVNPCA